MHPPISRGCCRASRARVRRRMAAPRRPRRRLPAGRALPLGRPRLHAHQRARAGARAPLPDQPVRPDVRRDHRVEPGQGRPRRATSSTTRRSRSTRPASRSTARSMRRATTSQCVLHTHTLNGVAVSAQKGGVLPISQQSIFVLSSLALSRLRRRGAARRREAAAGRRPRRARLPDAAQPRPAHASARRSPTRSCDVHLRDALRDPAPRAGRRQRELIAGRSAHHRRREAAGACR